MEVQAPPPAPPCWTSILKQQPAKQPQQQQTETFLPAAQKLVGSCSSTKGIAVAVVDANAIIQGGEKLFHSADRFVSVAEVIGEIRDPASRHALHFLPFTVDTLEPSPDALKKGNEFSGEIPRWLGESMPNLGVLILRSNMFSGSLPTSICHLANIQVLDISLNKVTGIVPSCMDNFTLLSSGIYSDSWSSIFSTFRNESNDYNFSDGASVIWKGHEATYIYTLGLLKMIDLSGNEFTGEIPPELTTFIGLVGLNLSGNNLVELIPKDIDKMEILNFLDLSRNNLSGSIPPSLSKLSHLGVLDLSFNNLSGRIPWDSHMQTFEASSFSGNPRLCGPPLLWRPCPEDDKPSNGTKHSEEEEEEEKLINRDFFISLVVGFVVAFWVVFWSLYFNKWWNVRICMSVGDWLYVKVLVNKRRLMMRFSGNAT